MRAPAGFSTSASSLRSTLGSASLRLVSHLRKKFARELPKAAIISLGFFINVNYRLLLVMVKPRHPSAAATDLARRQRCALALVAAGCLSLFIVTCMTFHSVISDEEYVDDRIAGLGIDGAGAGGDRRERAKGKTPKKRCLS